MRFDGITAGQLSHGMLGKMGGCPEQHYLQVFESKELFSNDC